MKRRFAKILTVIMLLNVIFTSLQVTSVYGAIEPVIANIAIQEEVNGSNVSYSVIFNGYPLTNVEAIFIREGAADGPIKKVLEGFTQISNANLSYRPSGGGHTVASIFGTTGNVYIGVVVGGQEYVTNKAFFIPNESMMKVEQIKNLSPASWPVQVNKGEVFTIQGTQFNPLYELGITTGNSVANPVGYTSNAPTNTQVTINTADNNVTAGPNQNLIFEKKNGDVTLRYIVYNALTIVNPLQIAPVTISPLQGTEGTIVRIRAGLNHSQLTDLGTKVYIGGIEAKRNTGDFSDGTFTYIEDGQEKRGLEVVVPRHTTQGPKPIVIRNYDGHVYNHPQTFNYALTTGAVLQIIDTNPEKAFTNEEKLVDLRIQNLISVNNIAHNSTITATNLEDPADLRYFKDDMDPKAFFMRYTLQDGSIIERKINVNIALKATLVEIISTIGDISTIKVRTDKVGQAGTYDITVRTETIHYTIDGSNNLVEKQYIVEEAPYASQAKVRFTFEPDITTPIISKLTPNKGPYLEDIVATIEGQNFRVENINGVRYYPRVILGSNNISNGAKYKVITKDENDKPIYYYSNNADGSNPIGGQIYEDIDFNFVVLDSANNVLDGQFRKSGTKIKFTIPRGLDEYSGFADLHVYNPSALGLLGGKDSKENFFEYVNPGIGTNLPVIESVSPDKVAVGKNEQVTIKGRNFQPGTIVTVDGEVVANPKIDLARGTIIFNAPNGRVGKTFVQVINPDGGFASHPFEYIQTFSQPTIQRIIPNVGGKGSLVIIKGSGFFVPNPAELNENNKIGSKVFIDGKDVNREYFREGDNPTGNLEMRDFINDYFPEAQEILGPNGDPLLTYGSNVAVVDSETIYVLIPDPRDGLKPFFMNEFLDVKVVNPDLGSHTLKKGFKFIDVVTRPYITSITPSLGDYRGGNIVEIQGDHFLENAKVYFGTQEAQVYRRSNNAKTLWVYVPPYGADMESQNQATVPVTVQNNDGGSFTRFDGYLYVNPGYDAKITKLTPNIGNTAGGDRILISGINFRAKNFGSADPDNPQELPAVYFGGVKVPEENITFVLPPKDEYAEFESTDLIIVEKTPANPAGKADVTVINFDGATANLKAGFEYRSKQPAITQVLPNQGSLLGGSEITIVGRDFVANGLHVVFGNEVGLSDILSGQASVKLGDIIVRYNAYDSVNNISLYYKEIAPGNELMVFKDGETNARSHFKVIEEEEFIIVRVPWKNLPAHQADEDTRNMADENIKIEIKNNDLVVTRRIGVIKRVEGESKITLITPPSNEVGQKQLRVFNYDGKFATSQFTFTNPFRAPIITKIIPASTQQVTNINGVTYNPAINIDVATTAPAGGSPIIIEGENFRAGVKVYIGGKEAEIKTKSANDNELIVIVPQAATDAVGPYLRILVVNQDGGAAYGDVVPQGQSRNQYWFRYIPAGSFPTITSVQPSTGPTSGGTKVTIKGTEFKNEDTFGNPKVVSVYIGGIPVPQQNVRYINPQTLEVTMPAGKLGTQTLEVVNYDHGRALGKDIFTYISQPEIQSVDPGVLFTNDTETEVTIKGTMFMPGAKVIVGGKLVLEKDVAKGETVLATGIRGVDAEGNNRIMSVVGGVEAASVTVVDENTLKVKFKEAFNLQNSHLIVVNTDGGLSSEYKNFEYRVPVPNKPLVLEGIPGAESSVNLIWSDSDKDLLNRAERYEIYGKKVTDRQYTYIGDTTSYEFLVKGLEMNTQYSFMVRAMNRYGSAIEFAEVTVRTFNQREDQQLRDKEAAQNSVDEKQRKEGKVVISNGTVTRTIGTEEIPIAIPAYVIDFSLSQYKNQNKYVIAIPLPVVENLNRKIMITDGTIEFTILPRDLYTREAIQVPQPSRNDAHVQIVIERLAGQQAESIKTAVSRTQQRASEAYDLSFQLQVGKNIQPMSNLVRGGQLNIKHDTMAFPVTNRNRLFVGEYDVAKHLFNKAADGQQLEVKKKIRFMLLSQR